MAYILKLSNGKVLLTLSDQKRDSVTTSLTLIGKNVNAYGTDINDNFIRLMENFANTSEPTSPLVGQIWFNTEDQKIYVYNNSQFFKPIGSPTIQATAPEGLAEGDFWIDSVRQQLHFWDGTRFTLVGPGYNSATGKSGIMVEDILDNLSRTQTVANLYSNDKLIALITSSTFSLSTSLATTMGIASVVPGINLSSDVILNGTSANSNGLGSVDAGDFIASSTSSLQLLYGPIDIFNDEGLSIGTNNDFQFTAEGSSPKVATMAISSNDDFNLLAGPGSCLYYRNDSGNLGVFTTNPIYKLHVNGDVGIQGNLHVTGNSTYVTTADLRVDDKAIELAYVAPPGLPSNNLADGGGIILHGDTDKTFLWNSANGTFGSWTSSESLELVAGKSFRINNNIVLSETSLGIGVTDAPGLVNLGQLQQLGVGQVYISTSAIGTINYVPLILGRNSDGVKFDGNKLSNVATPTGTDSPDHVATKEYVDSAVTLARVGQYTLNIDVTGHANSSEDPNLNDFVLELLTRLLPPDGSNIPNNAIARILVTRYNTTQLTTASNAIGFTPAGVVQYGTNNEIQAIAYSTGYVANVTFPGAQLVVNRAIKRYVVSGNAWQTYPVDIGGSNTLWVDDLNPW
jgi:hypothetical protein